MRSIRLSGRELWSQIAQLGITPDLPVQRAKRVVLCNQVALVAALMSVDYIVAFLLLHMPAMALHGLIFQIFYGSVLWLNHRRKTTLSRVFLATLANVDIFASVLIMGPRAGVQLLLFLTALGPFLIFGPDERTLIRVNVLASGVLFMLLDTNAQLGWIQPLVTLDSATIVATRMTTIVTTFILVALMLRYLHLANARTEARLEAERTKSDQLLLNVLPKSIADRLKDGAGLIADRFEEATVLFADIVNFTPYSARVAPEKLVSVLNDIFSLFDELADRHGLEKIKTIGDAYMIVGGLPNRRSDHTAAVANIALEMQTALAQIARRHGEPFELRIGIHTGPVVAGVIGTRKFIYDLWGDTVNTASRMESHGVAGAIQVTEAVQRQLDGQYELEARGLVEVKGKGKIPTWILKGKSAQRAASSAH